MYVSRGADFGHDRWECMYVKSTKFLEFDINRAGQPFNILELG